MPKLILKEKGSESEKSIDFEREEISLGRADINSVILEGAGVSRKHAKIFPEGKDFFIEDLGSRVGTKINGMNLPKEEKYILKHNDIINIEKFDIRFQLIDEMLSQSFNEITDSDILEVKLLKKVLRALDRESLPSIEVLNGVCEGRKTFITEDITELTIGRDPMSAFPIEEYVVSRNHAQIVKKWGGIIIQDTESKNGVYVNNRRVQEEFLHDGDRIALGTIVLMFRNPKEVDIQDIGKNMIKNQPQPKVEEAKQPKEEESGESTPEEDDASFTGEALPEEEQEKLVQKVKKSEYPVPQARKQRIKFSAIELSLMGVGILIFIFAIIMIVNVILS